MEREEILRRFEAWLDRVLAAEEAPQGIAAELLASLSAENPPETEGPADLYSMQAAVTGLTQEVKLQGRSFKQLSETLAPLADMAPQLAALQHEAQVSARREMLDVLLDLRDRLGRGLEAARVSQTKLRDARQSNWPARWLARHSSVRQASEGLAALVEGYRLSLERLDEVLAQSDVRAIDCQGQPFDPDTMYAVDVEETDRATEGTVVEVYRTGYEWKGEVHRPAQVKVARKPTSKPTEDDEDE
ncbi:MAG: nucleotide exchange factor GrpE [Terriglobia bacterium]